MQGGWLVERSKQFRDTVVSGRARGGQRALPNGRQHVGNVDRLPDDVNHMQSNEAGHGRERCRGDTVSLGADRPFHIHVVLRHGTGMLAEFGDRLRSANEIALHLLAFLGAEEGELFCRFHAFGKDR